MFWRHRTPTLATKMSPKPALNSKNPYRSSTSIANKVIKPKVAWIIFTHKATIIWHFWHHFKA